MKRWIRSVHKRNRGNPTSKICARSIAICCQREESVPFLCSIFIKLTKTTIIDQSRFKAFAI